MGSVPTVFSQRTLGEFEAVSKEEFLVKAAERDGFVFADGVFRPGTSPRSFAVTRGEDLASIDERGRRLQLLANDRPADAIGGARELVESVCRTILHLSGEPAPGKTADLIDVATSTLKALALLPAGGDAKKGAVLARSFFDSWKGLSPRHARLAIGAAVTFAGFIAETYVERAG